MLSCFFPFHAFLFSLTLKAICQRWHSFILEENLQPRENFVQEITFVILSNFEFRMFITAVCIILTNINNGNLKWTIQIGELYLVFDQ